MIKEPAKTDCEYKVTENRVVQAGKEKRSRSLISDREKKPSNRAESHGHPVPEYNVHESERHCAGDHHPPTAAKQPFVPMKEKRSVEQFLRVNRNKWIEKKN